MLFKRLCSDSIALIGPYSLLLTETDRAMLDRRGREDPSETCRFGLQANRFA